MNFITRFKNNIAYLELFGDNSDQNDYLVEFIDLNTNKIEYSTKIKINYWSQLSNIQGMNILIRVSLDNQIIFERRQDFKYNKVYIKFGSTSLGDSVAWIPYAEEYRKKYNVDVILYSNFNYLFDEAYPDIIFTNISDPNLINDVDKKFKIDYGPELYYINGIKKPDNWFEENKKYDNCVDNFDYRKYSLQTIAAIILGLPEVEIIPKINIPNDRPKIKGKYVVVAIQSTAQLKYWNNQDGWDRLFEFLGKNGYKIVLIDKYKSFGICGCYNVAPKSKYVINKCGNHPLSERINDIKYADMMITISSGLAWVSWAVGTPVVMISGFTKPWYEFKSNNIRIHNPNVCNGCWNECENFDLHWLYCPKLKNFECTRKILAKDVIDAIKPLIKKE